MHTAVNGLTRNVTCGLFFLRLKNLSTKLSSRVSSSVAYYVVFPFTTSALAFNEQKMCDLSFVDVSWTAWVCWQIWKQSTPGQAASLTSLADPRLVNSDNAACQPKKQKTIPKPNVDHVVKDSPYVSLRGTVSPNSKVLNSKVQKMTKHITSCKPNEIRWKMLIKSINQCIYMYVLKSILNKPTTRDHVNAVTHFLLSK